MKKLMVSVMLVGAALCGIAEEKAAETAKTAAPAAVANAANAKAKRARPPFDRTKFEAAMKARIEARKAKMTEILKKYGVADDKIGACVDELVNINMRQPRMLRSAKAPATAPGKSGSAK